MLNSQQVVTPQVFDATNHKTKVIIPKSYMSTKVSLGLSWKTNDFTIYVT